MDFRDYYATLGVAKTASAKEIKQAYRRLARKHHPDVNPGDRAAETTFKEVNEAYEVLGTPETRKKYDELGANWRQYEQAPPGSTPWGAPGGAPGGGYRTMTPEEMSEMFGGGSPFSDFFNTFFGGQAPPGNQRQRRSGGRPRRAPEVEYEVSLDLAAALGGRVETLTIETPGAEPRRIEVRIPAGITDGTRLKAGDVYLRVKLLPHPRFERQGRDLTTPLAVPLTTAVLGGSAEVPTLSGSRLTVKVPPGTQSGQRLRFKGQGLPAPGAPDDRGDLFAKIEVRVPTTLSAEARTHYEALRELGDQ